LALSARTQLDSSDEAGATKAKYLAFISYSHSNEPAARRLQHWLETYRIPRRLAGSKTAMGAVERRLTPIFRDRLEMPATSSLDGAVREALESSRALLVLCSPEAKASRWVNAEIRLFRSLYPDRPVIAALLSGDPQDSFPEALLEPDASGIVKEPVAADFRKNGDGKKLARLKIVAGLTGLALDQLIQREAQRQMRRVIAVTLTTTFLTLVMGLTMMVAIYARLEAEHQRRQAEGLIEFMLTDLRGKLQGVGRLEILQSVNDRALAYYGEQSDLSSLPPESLERRARVLHAMGEDDHRRGDYAAASVKFQEAHRVTEALLKASPRDPARIFAHAQSEFWVGYVDFTSQHFAEASTRFVAYRALARQLTQIEPNNMQYWRELGYAHGNICTLAITRQGPTKDLHDCRDALVAMERVARATPGDKSIQADLANRHAWMADAFKLVGREKDALKEREQQMAIIDALRRDDPKNATYLQAWMLARYSTAQLLHAMKQQARAASMSREARRVIDQLIASDPENNDWKIWRKKFDNPMKG
jgi:tetratricopeptide (TPR) repeat protein